MKKVMLQRRIELHVTWRPSLLSQYKHYYKPRNATVTLHCSVRWILFLLEELNNNSFAVHTSSRTVTHMREILQATGTYDPADLLEGSVYYTILIFMNSKKHGYTSLSIFQHTVLHAKLALGHH